MNDLMVAQISGNEEVKSEKSKIKKKKNYPAFMKNKLAFGSAIILLIACLMVIFAPLIAQYDPNELDMTAVLQGCSEKHWFGTDMQGRDIFSRILYGGRTAMLSPILVVFISTALGVPIGLFCGFFGGKIDNFIMRICDVVLSIPVLLLALITVSIFGRGITNSIIILGIFYVPLMARMVRSSTIVQKEQAYIEACYALGYSKGRIIFKHILPNCISTVLVQSTLNLGYSMLDLAGLSFLGLGVQPPNADWGTMIAEGRQVFTMSPNTCLASGFAIMVVVICFNLLGDGLDAQFDPKRKKV